MANKKGAGRPSTKIFKTPDGKILDHIYCRRCQQELPPRLFYEATDQVLDKNGYMSVCKPCISEVFMSVYNVEPNLETSILKTCRIFNVAYMDSAIDATRTWIENRRKGGEDIDNAFGFYKSKVGVFARLNPSQPTYFEEPSPDVYDAIQPEVGEEHYDLVEFWGAGLDPTDYQFLESELANFKKTHKSDTYSELVLLKEVCFVLLDIQKARQQNKATASHVKALQEIMKSLAISPNIANTANANKSTEAFGLWIKDIEELTPAEWHDKHELFKDMDNLGQYFEDYFVRPIRNFITGSRDFNVQEDGDIQLQDVDYFEDEE